jgi:hypothetical protein
MAVDFSFERKRQRRLAHSREPVTAEAFLASLVVSGVREDTAAFILEMVNPYYLEGLTPQADDRFESTLRIDPEDMCAIVELYMERFALPPLSDDDPIILPEDPSLQDLAALLDSRRDRGVRQL